MTDATNPPVSLRRQLVQAFVGSAGVRLAGVGLTFIVGVQLARYLGPADYGVYGSFLAYVTIAAVVAQFGMPQLLARELAFLETAEAASRAKGALTYFPFAALALSLAVVVALVAAKQYWPPLLLGLNVNSIVFGLSIVPVVALINIGMGSLYGLHRAVSAQMQDALVRPGVFGCVLFALAHLAAIRVDAGVALMAQAVACVVSALVCAAIAARAMPAAVLRAPRSADPGGWLRSATPMALTELLRTVDGQLPILILGALVSASDVGHYRVGLAIAGFVGLPSTLVNLVLMSHFARLHRANDMPTIQRLAGVSAAANFAAASMLTLAAYLFGKPVISLVFGAAYLPSWEIVCIIGLGYCVDGFFGSVGVLLNMCGQERLLTKTFGVSLVVGFAIALVLIPITGIAGMAWGTVCAHVVLGALNWSAARRKLAIDTSLYEFLKVSWRLAFSSQPGKRAS